MNSQKVFTREDGHKVKVTAKCFVDFSGAVWSHYVEVCQPGKRKFYQVDEKAATPEEVLQTKMELYKTFIPK